MKRKYPYTPGPWVVESGAVYDCKGRRIAFMDRNADNNVKPVERDSNAQLIAAAPDMLEALQAILESPSGYIRYVTVRAKQAVDKAIEEPIS